MGGKDEKEKVQKEKLLTPKQQRFVEEYLLDLNATQACIRAGYSPKTADRIGPKLVVKSCVATAIQAAKAQRSEKTGIDARFVLTRLADMLEADIADILDDAGKYKPVKQWPKIWRQMLNGMDVESSLSGLGYVTKIKFTDRIKTLELIGKHTDVGAFLEKIQHEAGDRLADILSLIHGSK